ncbi:MAG: M20 family metallopeptidase [Acidobacteriota bacterium]
MNLRAESPGIAERLATTARALADIIVAHQRTLHRFPELAFEERRTSAWLADTLRGLGLEPHTGLAGTGLAVELPGAGPGPTVMLRADMDGLPIREEPSHEPRSEHEDRMHACGHDGHMAVALGAAEAVVRVAGEGGTLPGRLVVLFQPAEETGTGAARIVEEGVLDRLGVDYVLGLHLWSFAPRGQAIVPDGTVMASADEFRVAYSGRGGHGALPHEADDVVLALAHLVVALQALVSREVDPVRPAVLSVGRIKAGSAPNVLPTRGELEGTFRAPDTDVRGHLLHRVGELARSIAAAHGVEAEVSFGAGIPPTVNHPGPARLLRAAAAAVLGPDNVRDGPPTMAAEDFGLFLRERPGAFMLLGMRDEAAGVVAPHHHPDFRVAPGALAEGCEILLRAAVALMESRADGG